jgi:hypothetical protein
MEDARWETLDRQLGRADDDERTPLWYRLFERPAVQGDGEREGRAGSVEEKKA